MAYLAACRFASTASNITRSTIEYAAQTACSLLVTASRASEYVQSIVPAYWQEVWVIGQGALITACGIATVTKASRATGSRKWRVLAMGAGVCAIGCGISAIIDGVGRLCSGGSGSSSTSLQHRQTHSIHLQTSHEKRLRETVCLNIDAPGPFEQTCDPLNYKHVLVMCHVADGKGDVVHCARLFKNLESEFLQHHLEIGMPSDIEPYTGRYFPAAFCERVNFIDSYTKLAFIKRDLIVDCPVIVDASQFSEVVYTIADGTTPHLGVTEFDFKLTSKLDTLIRGRNHTRSTFLTARLKNSSIGLPFDSTRYSATLRTGPSELDRLRHLRNITSKPLQEAILGEPYSEAVIEAFHKKFSLYTSYTKHSMSKDAFFSTILRTVHLLNETRDPCFVFVGRPPFEVSSGIPISETTTFTEVRALGFGRIDFFQSVQNISEFHYKSLTLEHASQPIRTVRVVTVPYTQNQNFLALSSAGRIGQATGDLSAVEMLEALTPFVYEELSHKTAFAKALLQHAESVDPNLGQMMRNLMVVFNDEKGFFRDYDLNLLAYYLYDKAEVTWKSSAITQAASALKYILENPRKWQLFIKHLIEHHNSFERIQGAVQHYLR